MRSLFWKEWSENRAIVPASMAMMLVLCACALTYGWYSSSDRHLHEVTPTIFEPILLLFWLIPATLCSSTMVAGEIGSGTLQFLSSLPLSRNSIWWIKSATALFVLLLSVLCSEAVFGAIYYFACAWGLITEPFKYVVPVAASAETGGLIAMIPLFTLGSLATVTADSAVTSILVLFGLSIAYITIVIGAASIFPSSSPAALYWGVSIGVLLALFSLFSSNRIFVKGETLQSSSGIKIVFDSLRKLFAVLLLPLLDLLAIIVSLIISYFWLTR